jgi:sugar transferase EpsL
MSKRLFDIAVALVALVLLAPMMLVVALLIRWKLGSPVLFRQVRPGLGEKPFMMVKFRTMRDACDADGKPLADSQRITPYGRFLRATSLDELPELWNVLRGDMSLVGPRPLLMEYLGYYTEAESLRHSVRPGITGLAQVSGRNATTWNERLSHDIQYVKRRSFWLDLKILLKTLHQVFKREGVVVVPSERYRKLSDERRGA